MTFMVGGILRFFGANPTKTLHICSKVNILDKHRQIKCDGSSVKITNVARMLCLSFLLERGKNLSTARKRLFLADYRAVVDCK